MSTPIFYEWSGEAMVPLPRFHNLVNAEFVVGECYRLGEVQDRSMRSHNHFFAVVHDAWLNMPETYEDRFQTSEHLRKWCLIKAGYRDERSIVASSKAEALRIAAFIKPVDDFAVVVTHEATVTIYTAKSQSKKAMGAEVFQKSKDAVLRIIDEMLGVQAGDTAKHAGNAA